MAKIKRIIGVVTTSRADYGIYYPLLKRLTQTDGLELKLIVTGMHLSKSFGYTVDEIERDGFPIETKIETLTSLDTPEGTTKSMGLGLTKFAEFFQRSTPDILVVLGDRFEMFAAALAALPFSIPIAHIGGGAVTEGAFDDSLRHALTKIAHLHFVETENYRKRIIKMGEMPWRVSLCGALSLDNLKERKRKPLDEINGLLKTKIKNPFLIVSYHPVTRELGKSDSQIISLFEALDQCDEHLVFSSPNADPAGRFLAEKIEHFVSRRPDQRTYLKSFGSEIYLSLMAIAKAMIGNSSSGIVEAASFGLPVVNIGIRQKGRDNGINVIHVNSDTSGIVNGLKKAVSKKFRKSIDLEKNIYDQGGASKRIIEVLQKVPLDDNLTIKRFFDSI